MAVVQSGTPATPAQTTTGTGTVVVTGSWGTGQARAVPNLLVALVTAWGSTSAAATAQNAGTTGWTKIYEAVGTSAVAAVWTKPATGGDAAPAFTSSIAGTAANTRLSCTLIELTDNVNAYVPVVDVASTGTVVGTTGTLTVTTVGNVAAAGEYAIAVQCAGGITSAANTWGTSGSFTNSFNDAATAFGHWVVGVQASPASGSTLAYAPSHTITSTRTAGEVVVFKPGGAYSQVQAGPVVHATTGTTVTPTCAATTAGNLLVIPCSNKGSVFTLPAGWLQAITHNDTSNLYADVWYYPNCPAGITSVVVTMAGGLLQAAAQILEYHDSGGTNAAPLDVTGGVHTIIAATSLAIATSAAAAAGDVAVASSAVYTGASTSITVTAGPGFTQTGNYGSGVAQTAQCAFDNQLVTAAAVVTDTMAFTSGGSDFTGAIATFKPAPPNVTVDSVGPSSAGVGQAATPTTWTHTTVAASTTVLVAACLDGVAPAAAATCTLGGTTLTQLGSDVPSGTGGTTGIIRVWQATGVAAGAHTIVVSCASQNDMTGGSIAFTGAGGFGTPATSAASATGSQYSINVPASTAGNLIAAFAGAGNSITATNGPATSRFVNNFMGSGGAAGGNCAGATRPACGSRHRGLDRGLNRRRHLRRRTASRRCPGRADPPAGTPARPPPEPARPPPPRRLQELNHG